MVSCGGGGNLNDIFHRYMTVGVTRLSKLLQTKAVRTTDRVALSQSNKSHVVSAETTIMYE